MSVVLCGHDLPAVTGSCAAVAALDGAAIDRSSASVATGS